MATCSSFSSHNELRGEEMSIPIPWKIAASLVIFGIVLEIPWVFTEDNRYAKIVACCTFLPSIVLVAMLVIVGIWTGNI